MMAPNRVAVPVMVARAGLAVAVAASLLPMAAQAQMAQMMPPPVEEAASVSVESTQWSTAEVTKELARCAQLLRGLDIVAKPLPPLKEHDCGTPAPVELISIGRSPQVMISPPVTVTCDLAAAMHRWVKSDLQPLARKNLGAEVVRIDTMSSYSCRTAYGRKNTKMSEHGRANAVDIKSFTTTKGVSSEVLADWGMTGREIAAQVAAAKKSEGAQAVAKAPAAAGSGAGPRQAIAPSSVATGSINGVPGVTVVPTPSIALGTRDGGSIGLGLPSATDMGLSTGMGALNRLGGPKATEDVAMTGSSGAKTDFLRGAHSSACRVFGTVLGPEANTAHRNHFHVDMAERKLKAICE